MIPMSSEDLLRRYFAVEMGRDVDAIVALYAPTATFRTPELLRTGHDEIRPFYTDAVTRFPTLDVEVVSSFDRGEWAVVEWSARMVGTDGVTLPLTGVNVARFAGGLLAEVRAYYDTGSYGGSS